MILFLLPIVAWANTFDGEWRQDCISHKQKIEIFSGEKVALHENYYSDEACGNKILELVNAGKYKIFPEQFTLPAQMDFEFESVQFIPWSATMVESFNHKKMCGFDDWQLGMAKEVSSLYCVLYTGLKPIKIPAPGEMRYGIYELQGEKLFLGQLSPKRNGQSPETRPEVFEAKPYQRFIQPSFP